MKGKVWARALKKILLTDRKIERGTDEAPEEPDVENPEKVQRFLTESENVAGFPGKFPRNDRRGVINIHHSKRSVWLPTGRTETLITDALSFPEKENPLCTSNGTIMHVRRSSGRRVRKPIVCRVNLAYIYVTGLDLSHERRIFRLVFSNCIFPCIALWTERSSHFRSM